MKSNLMDSVMFKNYLKEKKMLSDSSVYVYVNCIQKFLVSDPELNELDDYNKFIIDHAIKKRNSHYYSIIKSFIEFKITDVKLRERLINGLLHPRLRRDIVRERRHLNEEKILEIINSLERKKHRIIAIIQNMTGVRAGDVLNLKQGRILPEEYEGRTVLRLNIIGKRKKRNVVFIHDKIAQHLIWEYVTNNPGYGDFYFVTLGKMKHRRGNLGNDMMLVRMNYVWYWKDLKQALQLNGVQKEDFATHDLRRCFARRAWERYKDIHVLQGLLNHADANTTLRYLDQSGLKNIDYLYDIQMK